jgi:hypothetical protein
MAYEIKDNTGTLGKNDRKETESQPTHKGSTHNLICPHCGVPASHWISAWVKESAKGRFFSLSFQPKDEKRERVPGVASTPIDLDDEIPF